MSFFGVSLVGTSLDSFQAAANATADNISNVNTPGASRQVVDLTEAPAIVGSPFGPANPAGRQGTRGEGAIVSQLQRIHADSYDSLFRGASSSQNFYTVQQQTLQALQSSLGDPQSGINTQYTNFQTAISQLAAQPSSVPVRANVIQQAQALANALNSASSTIATQKAQLLQQGTAAVVKVNGILDQIAALNSQIRASTAVGDNPNTFKDQRDYLIDQLSQYLSTQTSIQANGSTLVTVNGKSLVTDTIAYHLSPPIVGTASNGAPTFKIGFANDPNPANPTAVPLGSGQLASYADLYNNKLTVYGQQLDAFAASLALEVNRVTMAGYDQNGVPGAALFQPITGGLGIAAGNIKCGITDPAQIPAALANTSSGNLVVPLNSANNTVDTSQAFTGNQNYANPPAGALTGTLTVTVDGVAQVMNYNTGGGGSDQTLDQFITHFNSMHYGVTASFDSTSQRVVFARDPSNIDLVHRAAQQAAATQTDPTFTITDSNFAAGNPSASLIGVVGGQAINAVQQNNTNALGQNDNAAASALLKLFSTNVGVPPVQTSVAGPIAAGAQNVTLPAGVSNIQVGTVLTIDARPGAALPQENVVVSAVSFNPVTGIETITATFANAHPGPVSITSAQQQTLGQAYGQTITQIGLDGQSATTGVNTQTNLSQSLDKVRQSIDGINMDEETQNLVKYQNAYQAAARTINVLDQLLGTVVNSLGNV